MEQLLRTGTVDDALQSCSATTAGHALLAVVRTCSWKPGGAAAAVRSHCGRLPITGLGAIVEDEEHIVIGCGVTHTMIVNDQRINRSGTCLSESCGVIGGPQVRNTGTLAGNVAHALPAGDGTIGLLALGGEVEIAEPAGTRWMPAKDTFEGPGRSVIDRHREILTRLRFKPTERQ